MKYQIDSPTQTQLLVTPQKNLFKENMNCTEYINEVHEKEM